LKEGDVVLKRQSSGHRNEARCVIDARGKLQWEMWGAGDQ